MPYLTVYGKELGISEVIMGSITAVVPITFLLAKPVFGFIADYFYEKRKLIFIILIISMSVFYLGLYFIPPVNIELEYNEFKTNYSTNKFCQEVGKTNWFLILNVASHLNERFWIFFFFL